MPCSFVGNIRTKIFGGLGRKKVQPTLPAGVFNPLEACHGSKAKTDQDLSQLGHYSRPKVARKTISDGQHRILLSQIVAVSRPVPDCPNRPILVMLKQGTNIPLDLDPNDVENVWQTYLDSKE